MIHFTHPSTFLISGPTGSGKTSFIVKLLNQDLISPSPSRIILIYNEFQTIYETINKPVEYKTTLDETFYSTLNPSINNLIVLDDKMSNIGNSGLLSKLFTEGSHHRNLSVIYIVQNLFDKGKSHRSVSLNAQYLVLFKNPRDCAQVQCLARQMYPNKTKFLVDSFTDATKEPYGYLTIDLRPETDDSVRVRTKVFKGEICEVYQPI